MKPVFTILFGGAVLAAAFLARPKHVVAQGAGPGDQPLTRIAEIEIDPQQVEPYRAALREGISAAVRLEPGVLSISAVSLKDHPEQIRVLEVYKNREAYEAHLQTPHFRKYKASTLTMVRSLRLLDTEPILLAGRP